MSRKTIRDNIRTALLNAAPVAALVGARVTIGRGNVTTSGVWPAIYLYPERDEVNTHTLSVPREQMRTHTLIVDYWVKPSGGAIEDAIDDAADKIVDAVLSDTTQGGACSDTLLTSLDYVTEGREDARFGVGRMTFAITHFTRE